MHIINLGADGDEPLVITTEDAGVGEGDEEVVGLEEDLQAVLRRGVFNEQGHSTMVLKGMPGIGKTALARQVYNHASVVGRFKKRAWVRLSSDLTNREALMKLIVQVVGTEEHLRDSLVEKMERSDNRSLRQMLRQHLQGTKYLIVVDNNLKGLRHLRSVLKCLPVEGRGSRLLFTSRSLGYVATQNYVHEMKALDLDKSWQLFVKTINKFTSDEEQYKFSKDLEKKGKKMLAKCGGLPLAIIDVGRQKAKQRLEKGIEWEELLEIDSIDLSASLELLESSYRELDQNLQECFLYVAFFKENALIRAKKLEQIWVAAGGFPKGKSQSFMETLAHESFVEVEDKDARDNIKYCRINPLLHRLSIKIAEEEMGFEILRKTNGNSNGVHSPISPRRHRVVHCGREKFNHYSTIIQDKHLVSLIFHGGGSYLDDANWKRFELLNILDLDDFGLKILSETIGTSLMKLKYLGLRNNHIQEIPHSLGCLKELEVLDISQNFMVEVPDIIWEMSGLHHLHMSDVICPKPLKMDKLEHLETLTYISVYNVLGLETMSSLQRLGIEEVDENSDVSKLFESLAKLQNLSRLTLRGFRLRSMPCLDEVGLLVHLRTLKLDGLIARLPSADNFPPNIEELSLVNSCLDEDPMPVLDRIPNLTYLKLRNAYTGQQMVIRKNGFRFLKVLCIKELWNLRNLKVSQVGEGEPSRYSIRLAGMKHLSQLEIDNCPNLDTIPEEILQMTRRLKKFKMLTTKNIATKIRKSGLISQIEDVDISP